MYYFFHKVWPPTRRLCLFLLLVNFEAVAQTDSLLPAKEFSPRGGLPNFYKKLSDGKPVDIAFLGGSITRAGNGYRDQILNWFRKQYPANKVEEIMAAV